MTYITILLMSFKRVFHTINQSTISYSHNLWYLNLLKYLPVSDIWVFVNIIEALQAISGGYTRLWVQAEWCIYRLIFLQCWWWRVRHTQLWQRAHRNWGWIWRVVLRQTQHTWTLARTGWRSPIVFRLENTEGPSYWTLLKQLFNNNTM